MDKEDVVPRRGLEPPQGFPHMDLNHARLPISPPRHFLGTTYPVEDAALI